MSGRWSVGPSVRPSDRPSVCNRLVFRPTKNDLYRVYGFVFPCPVAVSEEICLLFLFEKKKTPPLVKTKLNGDEKNDTNANTQVGFICNHFLNELS